MEYPKFKVTVSCMTYNQSKYITDAMNGFTMQQTSFPFVCTIVDDASTDGEQDVIRKYVEDNFDFSEGFVAFHKETDYAHITYAQHKTNKNCYFAVLYLKENHYSQRKPKMGYLSEWRDMCEYEAICEGDDYWIDPLKLQKQVDYLDAHLDYSMCFTGAKVLFDGGFESQDSSQMRALYKNLENREYQGEELLQNWLVPTASILRRVSVGIRQDIRFMFGDIVIVLSCVAAGKIRCLAEEMVVYRRNANGVSAKSQSLPRSIKHYQAIADVFGERYRKICNKLIYSSIASCILTSDKQERKDALEILRCRPSLIVNVMGSAISICFKVLLNKFR